MWSGLLETGQPDCSTEQWARGMAPGTTAQSLPQARFNLLKSPAGLFESDKILFLNLCIFKKFLLYLVMCLNK